MSAAHIDGMAKKSSSGLEMLCIVCSGGAPDRAGAYTVCALCELTGAAVPVVAAAA